MYLSNNLEKVRRIGLVIIVLLLIAYPIVHLFLEQGSFISFVIVYPLCVILPLWYTQRVLKRWTTEPPLIVEKKLLQEVYIDRKYLKSVVEDLAQHQKWRVVKYEQHKGIHRIILDTSVSLYSLGEIIRIIVTASEDQLGNIEIKSSPKIPTTAADSGKNKANVEAVQSFLNETLHTEKRTNVTQSS